MSVHHMCACCPQKPEGARSPATRVRDSWELPWWVLRIEPVSPGRAASALKDWATVPAFLCPFFFEVFICLFLGFLYTLWISVSYKISFSNALLMSFSLSLDSHTLLMRSNLFLYISFIFITFLCVGVCIHVYHGMHWRSENHLLESVLFYHVDVWHCSLEMWTDVYLP